MKQNYFHYNNKQFYRGTVVKIHNDKIEEFDYNFELFFIEADYELHELYFKKRNKIYTINTRDIGKYIEGIVSGKELSPPIKPKASDKEGFGLALFWTIIICLGSIFINGGVLIIIVTLLLFLLWSKK